jgi:hypothetical protein
MGAALSRLENAPVGRLLTRRSPRAAWPGKTVPDPSDRRATLVRATPSADLGYVIARDPLAHIEKRWERSLGREHLRVLANQLYQLATSDDLNDADQS